MVVSKGAWITVLVAGIMSLLTFMANRSVSIPQSFPNYIIRLVILIQSILIITGIILIIISLTLMRSKSKCKSGSIIALVISVVGFNIVGIVGSIIGIVKSQK